jgi:hypothetical protein
LAQAASASGPEGSNDTVSPLMFTARLLPEAPDGGVATNGARNGDNMNTT